MPSASIDSRVEVPKDKYLEILGFTMYAYFAERITAYSSMLGGVRSLGQYIENFIYGKIAEVALQIFLKSRLNIETLTDIDLADFIEGEYLPDLLAVKRDSDYEALRLWIEVKEVRRDQRWFLIPASAVRSRPYDVYVAVWVGLPDDHIAWLVKHVPNVLNRMSDEWKKLISSIEENIERIPCEIIGFVTWNDASLVDKARGSASKTEAERAEAEQELNKKFGQRSWHYFTDKEQLFDPHDPSWKGSKVRKENVGFHLKKLREVSDWSFLQKLILANKRLVGQIEKKGLKRGAFPRMCGSMKPGEDLRGFAQRCVESQLSTMKKQYGSILRNKSWFEQKI